MTSVTVRIETDGVVALIAEALSTRVAFHALSEADVAPLSITDDLLSYGPQQLPVVVAHVLGVPDAVLVSGVGSLEERRRGYGVPGEQRGDDTLAERK